MGTSTVLLAACVAPSNFQTSVATTADSSARDSVQDDMHSIGTVALSVSTCWSPRTNENASQALMHHRTNTIVQRRWCIFNNTCFRNAPPTHTRGWIKCGASTAAPA